MARPRIKSDARRPPRRVRPASRVRLALLVVTLGAGAALVFQPAVRSRLGLFDREPAERIANAGSLARRPGDGSARMAERLAAIAADAEAVRPEDTTGGRVFVSNQPGLIPVLRGRIAETADPLQRFALRFQVALQLLWDGRSREALTELESLEATLEEISGLLPADQNKREGAVLQGAIGIAALRQGEQENCLENHRASSCIFPLDAAAVHTLEAGARRAIEAFTKQLTLDPPNLGARWLLNLAYMTVGEYPARVPARWLLSPDVFRSEHDIGRFRDVSIGAGLDVVSLAGGSIMEDFDGDGHPDLMVSSSGLRDQLRFFRNDGNGRFTERTREAGLLGQWGGLNLNHADYDNDGHPDVLVLRGGWRRESGLHPNSLLRNNGDGTFDDVTEEAGLLAFHPTATAAWGDFNNDGWLDVFVGNEEFDPARPHPSQLYQSNGDGTFTERAAELGLSGFGVVKGAAWGDYDNDGRLDLYVSQFARPNRLFRNDGPVQGAAAGSGTWRFTDVTASAGVAEPIFSFPTWFWDYDNDGWLDLFAAAWDESPIDAVAARYLGVARPEGTPRLYRNNRDGTFRDVTVEAKLDRVLLAMGANFGDLDNDGFPDLYIGTGGPDLSTLMPNRMFRNAQGKYFEDVTTAGGFGHLQKGHGISFGDVDNDGDQDVHAVMGGWFSGDSYQNVLFENPGHGNHWITIGLEGTRSNRMGVGARVKIRVRTPRGERDVFATVSTGGSFGASTLQVETGLGDATAIERIEVTWPASGRTQTFRDVAIDRFVRIREDDDTLVPVTRPRFTFVPAAGHAGHAGPD
jgi:hypothetical protein